MVWHPSSFRLWILGFCCIQYTVCPEDLDAWSLDTQEADKAFIEMECTNDYIRIEGQPMENNDWCFVSRRLGDMMGFVFWNTLAWSLIIDTFPDVPIGGSNVCQDNPNIHINRFCGTFLSTSPEGDMGNEIICGETFDKVSEFST